MSVEDIVTNPVPESLAIVTLLPPVILITSSDSPAPLPPGVSFKLTPPVIATEEKSYVWLVSTKFAAGTSNSNLLAIFVSYINDLIRRGNNPVSNNVLTLFSG